MTTFNFNFDSTLTHDIHLHAPAAGHKNNGYLFLTSALMGQALLRISKRSSAFGWRLIKFLVLVRGRGGEVGDDRETMMASQYRHYGVGTYIAYEGCLIRSDLACVGMAPPGWSPSLDFPGCHKMADDRPEEFPAIPIMWTYWMESKTWLTPTFPSLHPATVSPASLSAGVVGRGRQAPRMRNVVSSLEWVPIDQRE
ncbi:hypothetical protein BDK51DRAFT_28695 [Blyttiomyces helicus]|uniref:Uncharacterized protein n=1 Tax=Blyttiomyces helicus TaxID=388810 RepID=A0A4P9W4S4_9FUNG|nr:hypothetical protein BDK51DRAFT_28695 [Blyttiomyces helicus]|eukprot:RKO87359.1 hypothetical protein BDK51DRAFT_28695 [Blyttiomyces helicus]